MICWAIILFALGIHEDRFPECDPQKLYDDKTDRSSMECLTKLSNTLDRHPEDVQALETLYLLQFEHWSTIYRSEKAKETGVRLVKKVLPFYYSNVAGLGGLSQWENRGEDANLYDLENFIFQYLPADEWIPYARQMEKTLGKREPRPIRELNRHLRNTALRCCADQSSCRYPHGETPQETFCHTAGQLGLDVSSAKKVQNLIGQARKVGTKIPYPLLYQNLFSEKTGTFNQDALHELETLVTNTSKAAPTKSPPPTTDGEETPRKNQAIPIQQ